MISTNEKQTISMKYKLYVQIIYTIGNKVILQKQLYELIKLLGVSKTDYETRKAIDELEKYEIIRREKYLDTNNKLIVLRKFAIRFIEGKDSSRDVSAVPKNIKERAIISIVKVNYIIKVIKTNNIGSFKELLYKLKHTDNNILYKKNNGIRYLESLEKNNKYYIKDNEIYIKSKEQNNIRNINLKRGMYKRIGKGGEGKLYSNRVDDICNEGNYLNNSYRRSTFGKQIELSTVDTLINANIFIGSIKDVNGCMKIVVNIFDINNTQNVNRIIEKMALTIYVMRKIFGIDTKFKFNIHLCNKSAVINVKDRLLRIENKDIYIIEKINSLRVDNINKFVNLIALEAKEDIRISIHNIKLDEIV